MLTDDHVMTPKLEVKAENWSQYLDQGFKWYTNLGYPLSNERVGPAGRLTDREYVIHLRTTYGSENVLLGQPIDAVTAQIDPDLGDGEICGLYVRVPKPD